MDPSEQERIEQKYSGKQTYSQTMNQEYQNSKQSVIELQSWEDYQLDGKPKHKRTVHDLINDKGYVIRKKD